MSSGADSSKPLRMCIFPHFFDDSDCGQQILKFSEETKQIEKLQTRKRIQFDSPTLAESIFDKLKNNKILYQALKIVSDKNGDWRMKSCNPHFRLVKYEHGDEFGLHEDGFYWDSAKLRSFASVTIYLNTIESQHGGATIFPDHGLRINPVKGTALIFAVDDIFHRGEKILTTDVTKYILRTDIMYENISSDPEKLDSLDTEYHLWRKAYDSDLEEDWDNYYKYAL